MDYLVPASVEEALGLAAGRARYVAGGTDLAVQLSGGASFPPALVDVSGLPELLRLEAGPAGLRIGAAVTIERLARAPGLPACLAQGARSIGSPQVRSLATIGGNLCNASPCGDTLAPVIVLDGRLVLASPGGRREVPAERFFTGPKATVLRPGELLVELLFGPQAMQGASAFRMIGQREGQAISQVNVAVWVRLGAQGVIEEVRAAAGSVAPTPMRLPGAERAVRGKPWSAELGLEAGSAAAAEVLPISDVRAPADYRRRVTAALFREALAEACGREA